VSTILCTLLFVTVVLCFTSFIVNLIRPSRHNTWIVAVLQVLFSVPTAFTIFFRIIPIPYFSVSIPQLVSELTTGVFLFIEAYQLARLFSALSDSLDSIVEEKCDSESNTSTWENVLRAVMLIICLGCLAAAAYFFKSAFVRGGFLFIGGGIVVLCASFIVIILFLKRGSIPVACLTTLLVAAQLAMLADIRADEVFNSGGHSSFLRYLGRFSTPLGMSKPRATVIVRPSIIVGGIFSLIASVVCGIKKIPGEEEDSAAHLTEESVDLEAPTFGQRFIHAIRCACLPLAPLIPCLVFLKVLTPCHTGWVLAQLVLMAGFHILHATSYEIHLFSHSHQD